MKSVQELRFNAGKDVKAQQLYQALDAFNTELRSKSVTVKDVICLQSDHAPDIDVAVIRLDTEKADIDAQLCQLELKLSPEPKVVDEKEVKDVQSDHAEPKNWAEEKSMFGKLVKPEHPLQAPEMYNAELKLKLGKDVKEAQLRHAFVKLTPELRSLG